MICSAIAKSSRQSGAFAVHSSSSGVIRPGTRQAGWRPGRTFWRKHRLQASTGERPWWRFLECRGTWCRPPGGGSGIQRCTSGCPFPTLRMPTPAPPCRKDRPRSIQRLRIPLRLLILLPVVTVPEYSQPLLKSRRHSPECLPVLLRYREALENSPGIPPRRRGGPLLPAPRRNSHLPSPRWAN